MSVTVVVGAQWGDEGKGKLVDNLAENADIIVRFQGGDNAGHTVVNPHGAFKLHIIPCGIFYPKCIALVGTGMVVNPDVMLEEIADIESKGYIVKNLRISSKATILMPYHVELDSLKEGKGGKGEIGTTKRGIGPAYADRAQRTALRFEDLDDIEYCKERIELALPRINNQIEFLGGRTFTVEELVEKCRVWAERFKGMIVEPVSYLNNAIAEGKNILFEGQLGAMKDLDLGIYPYVTSSNPVAPYAAVASGVPFQKIDRVIGIMKAFSSAVGKGPFPTEMSEEEAEEYRGTGENIDDEFGARTGRSRRIGHPDLPVVKYSAMINGMTELAVSKIDKLDTVSKIKVCVAYKLDGKVIDYMPNTRELERVEPVYEEIEGWLTDTTGIRKMEDLPENAKKYLKLVESVVGIPVTYAGVGPERNDFAV